MLQVNPVSGDKLEIVYESCYETKDTSIFTWSSIPGIGHYRCLCSLIRQLPLNSKVNYVVRTIRRTLLHIVPFCEGPNKKFEGFAKEKKKPKGFAKEKKYAKFAMQNASQLVAHHSSQI